MKINKFTLAVSTLISAVLAGNAYAGMYIGGSLSTMMETEITAKNKASTDASYYGIDCTNPDMVAASICTSGGVLAWSADDNQTMKFETDTDTSFGLAIGYSMQKYPVRFELEYASVSNTLKLVEYKIIHGGSESTLPYNGSGSEELSLTTIMANAYYGFNIGIARPYVGVGVGQISGEFNEVLVAGKPFEISGMGFQLMGGVEFPIGKTGLYVGAEYRYTDLGNVDVKDTALADFGGDTKADMDSGSISGLWLKVRYAFDEESDRKATNKRRPDNRRGERSDRSERAQQSRSRRESRSQGRSSYEPYYGGQNYYNNRRSYY